MKNNEATIFVFIASIIVGLLIAMNIGFEGENNFLDVKQYNEAYNERTKLYSELNELKQHFYKSNATLKKYDGSDGGGNDKILEEIKKEVIYNNQILGRNDLEGPGIEVTLDDGIMDEYNPNRTIVHESDLFYVLNDLRNAGAEAISVNGNRVIDNNYVWCGGTQIIINGINIVAPFYISAIGNQNMLYNYLTLEQTHIISLKLREVKVDITKKDNLQILAHTGIYQYKYMKPLAKKD